MDKPIKVKKHPCIVQYGSCKYGSNCKYASLPSDVCMKYLYGGCAFDTECRLSHDILGVDLHEIFPENSVSFRYDADGQKYSIPDKQENKPDKKDNLVDEKDEVIFSALPAPVQVPRYATTIRTVRPKSIVQKTEKQPFRMDSKIPSTGKHPCLKQLGSCKYGSRCAHRDLNGDICIFWLNHQCRNTRCTYRHSK